MKVTITFKHLQNYSKVYSALKEHIMYRSEIFERYLPTHSTVHWTVTREKQSIISHIHLTAGRTNLFSEAEDIDIKTSIDVVSTRMQTQLKKKKAILHTSRHRKKEPTKAA